MTPLPTSFAAALPTVREAFEALVAQADAAVAHVEQTQDVVRRRIGSVRDTWRRLDAGMEQWASLLTMARDSIRDMTCAQQPLAAASFLTLDPLLQNDIPAPDWDAYEQSSAPQALPDARRDAVEHLERHLALLTQFAVSCHAIAIQAGVAVPEEIASLLSPPFNAQPLQQQTFNAQPSSDLPPLAPVSAIATPPPVAQGFAPAGKAAEVVSIIQEHFNGKSDKSTTAAIRQAQALKTLFERWSSPDAWSALTGDEQARRSSLMQSLLDRAKHLGVDS